MSETGPSNELLRLSTQIVAAHLRHDTVSAEAVPEIIQAVHAALSNAGSTKIGDIPLEPALPIKRSVLPG